MVGNLLTGGGNEDPVITTLPNNTGTTAPLPQVTDDTYPDLPDEEEEEETVPDEEETTPVEDE